MLAPAAIAALLPVEVIVVSAAVVMSKLPAVTLMVLVPPREMRLPVVLMVVAPVLMLRIARPDASIAFALIVTGPVPAETRIPTGATPPDGATPVARIVPELLIVSALVPLVPASMPKTLPPLDVIEPLAMVSAPVLRATIPPALVVLAFGATTIVPLVMSSVADDTALMPRSAPEMPVLAIVVAPPLVSMPVPPPVVIWLLVMPIVPVVPVTAMPRAPAPVALIVPLFMMVLPVIDVPLVPPLVLTGLTTMPSAFAPVVVIAPLVTSTEPVVGTELETCAAGLTRMPVAPTPAVVIVVLLTTLLPTALL